MKGEEGKVTGKWGWEARGAKKTEWVEIDAIM